MAAYLGVYGPFVALLRWLFVCVLLVAHCFALCALVVCAPDRIATRQAVGVYRAGIDQVGVTPLTTAQNKKGGSTQTNLPRPDVSDTPFSRNASYDYIRSGRADAKPDESTDSFVNGKGWFFVS